jgi:flagellar protein FliJ
MASKGLGGLIRLQRFHLDARRRDLAEFDRLVARFEGQIQGLQDQMRREAELASKSGIEAMSYGPYVQGAILRRRNLERSLAEAQDRRAKAQAALQVAFEEVKRLELTAAERERRERLAAERVENIEQDERGIEQFRRRTE